MSKSHYDAQHIYKIKLIPNELLSPWLQEDLDIESLHTKRRQKQMHMIPWALQMHILKT